MLMNRLYGPYREADTSRVLAVRHFAKSVTYGLTYFISSWEIRGIVSIAYIKYLGYFRPEKELKLLTLFSTLKYGFCSVQCQKKKIFTNIIW